MDLIDRTVGAERRRSTSCTPGLVLAESHASGRERGASQVVNEVNLAPLVVKCRWTRPDGVPRERMRAWGKSGRERGEPGSARREVSLAPSWRSPTRADASVGQVRSWTKEWP